jgi:hypothetical protein
MRAVLWGFLRTFHPTLSAKMPAVSCLDPARTLSTTLIPKNASCLILEKETAMKWLDLTNRHLKSAITPLPQKQPQPQQAQAYFLNFLNF